MVGTSPIIPTGATSTWIVRMCLIALDRTANDIEHWENGHLWATVEKVRINLDQAWQIYSYVSQPLGLGNFFLRIRHWCIFTFKSLAGSCWIDSSKKDYHFQISYSATLYPLHRHAKNRHQDLRFDANWNMSGHLQDTLEMRMKSYLQWMFRNQSECWKEWEA